MIHDIAFVDLALRGEELEGALAGMRAVLERGWFILGPEVSAFESELAAAAGRAHAVGVASGTDALTLGLRAMGIGAGGEVIVPAMTAFPTAVAVLQAGATPVLVDVEPEQPFLDLDLVLAAITERTRAVILVHLYGRAADAGAFAAALGERSIALIEDCAQAQGASLPDGRPVGSAGAFAALSFYPTKNLAAVGDGGALLTDDTALADEVRAWRSHGERTARYLHVLPAGNSRLDDLQASILRPRLRALPPHVSRRRELSRRYEETLPARARYVAHGTGGAPHLAVIRCQERDQLAEGLRLVGIATGVHYPRPLQDQPALAAAPRAGSLDQAAAWAAECLSLPLHDQLSNDDIDTVVEEVGRLGAPWW